jgi:cell division septum initiation protein DivIVA
MYNNFMAFSIEQLQYVLIIVNFLVTAFLIGYSIYLYRIERNLRQKFRSVNTKAAKIIEDANNKAAHIINHSKYVSDEMKDHADQSFDEVLKNLENENKSFYKSLEQTYFDKSETFINEVETETNKDLKEFSDKIAKTTSDTELSLEKKLEGDYEEAKKDIEKFKEMKKKEFEDKLKERIGTISVSIMPSYLKINDQEKFVKEVMEKAATDGFFS